VVSDSVKGNLTIRLKNVPWDQALDIILKAKGLSERRSGNVLLIAPSEEIAAQEKIDMEAQKSMTDLAPIHSAFFNINFAKVDEIANILTGDTGTGSGDNTGTTNNSSDTNGNTNGILSDRGTLIVDKRTNTLIVKDTDKVISEVRRILEKLDVPVRQVMISSRIVLPQTHSPRNWVPALVLLTHEPHQKVLAQPVVPLPAPMPLQPVVLQILPVAAAPNHLHCQRVPRRQTG